MKAWMKGFASAALALAALAAQAAPTVTLTSPGNTWAYNVPAAVPLRATAAVDPADVGATLVRVEFYVDGVLVGSDATTAYGLTWGGTAPGDHVLTARAIDSLGQQTVSAPVSITLTDAASNRAPTVSLAAPANNAKYATPADITVTASAADVEKNGRIAQVEFLANGQVMGTRTATPYSLVWSNPPAGTYTLTARATDNLGAVTESAARTVIVQSNTPPIASLGGPTAGTYVLPYTLNLTASATGGEVNTPVTLVEYLANGQVIANFTAPPYNFAWANPAPGTYAIAVRATDSQGLVTTTATRAYTIADTNTPPTVALTAPANNAKYATPVDRGGELRTDRHPDQPVQRPHRARPGDDQPRRRRRRLGQQSREGGVLQRSDPGRQRLGRPLDGDLVQRGAGQLPGHGRGDRCLRGADRQCPGHRHRDPGPGEPLLHPCRPSGHATPGDR